MNAQPQFSIETVTPAKAAEYLKLNTTNRTVAKRTVSHYAAAMRRGEWQVNGEAIKFDEAGKLIDGQHRLLAVVEAGIAIDLGVFRALATTTFKTIDTGRNRTAGDLLSITSCAYPNDLAAALRLLYAYLEGVRHAGSRKASHVQIIEMLEVHRELPAIASAAMKEPLTNKLLPPSITMFCYYAASRVDAERAKAFFTELATGRFAAKGSDPQYKLRERLIQTSVEALRPGSRVKLAWVVTAWNAFVARRPVERLPREFEMVVRFSPEPKFPKSRGGG